MKASGKGELERKVERTIKSESTQQNKRNIKSYENATQRFEKLVSRGVAKHRGYNLMTSENRFSRKWL